MSSTNKTTNYELSQYVGTDKPTYLGDYNGDMLKIDTQMKANADSASSANSLATTAKNTADGAETHAQTAITNAETADGKAVSAQNTATSALTKATANEAKINNFNLTQFKTITKTSGNNEMTGTNCTIQNGSYITIAKNSDGSLAKIYGNLFISSTVVNNDIKITIPLSELLPEEEFSIINAGVYLAPFVNFTDAEIHGASLTLKTNGTLEINGYARRSGSMRIVMLPQLYFIKNFGDTPDIPV